MYFLVLRQHFQQIYEQNLMGRYTLFYCNSLTLRTTNFKQLMWKYVIMFPHQEMRFSRVELPITYERDQRTATLYIYQSHYQP